MQKLSYTVLDKLFNNNITNTELETLFLLSRYQDEKGIIIGVYYKDICQALDISYQKFYDILSSLRNKGIISYEKNSLIDYDVKILDNDFSIPDYKQGYLNTNYQIFYQKNFSNLKVKEKLLLIKLLKICYTKANKSQKSFIIGMKKFYQEFSCFLKVSKRSIRGYLSNLKSFFTVGLKNQTYYITAKNVIYMRSNNSESINYSKNIVKTICQRRKIKTDEKSIQDIAALMPRKEGMIGEMENKKEFLNNILRQAIEISVSRENKSKKEKVLKPSWVHKILKELLLPYLY